MGCLGVHFALTEADVRALLALEDDDERLEHLQEVIEEREVGGPWAAETDKAWDAIHRCFAFGKLEWEGGEYPLNHVILCGEPIYFEGDYIMSLKTPEQVREIAGAIAAVTESDLRARYRRLDERTYGFPLTKEDEGYTWENFRGLIDFYRRAVEAGRYVLFTADQG